MRITGYEGDNVQGVGLGSVILVYSWPIGELAATTIDLCGTPPPFRVETKYTYYNMTCIQLAWVASAAHAGFSCARILGIIDSGVGDVRAETAQLP